MRPIGAASQVLMKTKILMICSRKNRQFSQKIKSQENWLVDSFFALKSQNHFRL